ncbi:hypothetical protein BSKO_14055 [Bryopsis sp. KO-2023]|nr:hypothetical protein BSKO_14055 [Bryopsis sp. KO-2023]
MDDDTSALPLIDRVETRQPFVVRQWKRVWNNGPLLIILATMFFSGVVVAIKLLDGKVPQLQILFIRALLICFMMPTKIKCQSRGSPANFGRKENMHLLLMLGCAIFCHITTTWYAITRMPIADAMAIVFANTIFTAPIGLIARLEKWTQCTPVGLLLSLVGVLVVTKPPMIFGKGSTDWSSDRIQGMQLAVVGSVMIALVFLVIKRLDKREDADVLLLWQNVVISVFSFAMLWMGFPDKPVFQASPQDWVITALAVIAGVAAWFMINRGGQLTSATLLSVLTGIELGFTLLADVFIFGEVFDPLKLLGLACIVGASAIVAFTITPVVR